MKAGADGATQGVYVVNVFDTATAVTVDDPGRYTRVKNLTTEDELDVYKRQVLAGLPAFGVVAVDGLALREGDDLAVGDQVVLLLDSSVHDPVSYTHLDVYKRQMYNIQLWAQRAERVADLCEKLEPEECRARITELLTRACLPDDSIVPKAHYAQLIGAADSNVVTEAYRKGRVLLDAAIERILERAGVPMTPRIVVAIVDGAAVTSISEGLDVRETTGKLLDEAIEAYTKAAGC